MVDSWDRALARGAARTQEAADFMALPVDHVTCAAELLDSLGGSQWNLRRLLFNSQNDLDGLTGEQAIAVGREEDVLHLAETIGRGDFT